MTNAVAAPMPDHEQGDEAEGDDEQARRVRASSRAVGSLIRRVTGSARSV